jgi:hypothetical protein
VPPPRAGTRESLERSAPALAAAAAAATLLTVALFWRVALLNKLLLRRDMLRVVLPLKSFWAERVRAGQFPGWYPYDGFGQPFAGMMVSGPFHPGNLLFLVLPAGQALTWNALLCFPLLATGLWALLRRLGASPVACALGAVLVTFNGYAVCITNSLPYLQAMALVPWALVAAMRYFERPGLVRAVLGALVLALVLFAGDAQSFCVTCTLTLPVALWMPTARSARQRLTAWLGLMTVTALVALPQLVAGADVVQQTLTTKRSLGEALSWSMHPLRLLEVLVGPLFGTGDLYQDTRVTDALLRAGFAWAGGGMWVESVHFGAVGLLLGAAGLATLRGPRLRAAAALGVLGTLLLVLGKYGGLYEVLYRLVWLWRPFRYPEKLVPFLFLFFSVGAALGLDQTEKRQPVRRWVGRWALILAGALALLAIGEAAAHLFTRACQWLSAGALTPEVTGELRTNLFRGCALSVFGLLVTAWALRAPVDSHRRWVVPAVCMLIAFLQGEPLYGANAPEVLSETPFSVQSVLASEGLAHLGGARVYSAIKSHVVPNLQGVSFEDYTAAATPIGFEPVTPALYGLEGANIYLPAVSSRVLALRHSAVFANRLVGLFGASFIAAGEYDYSDEGGDPRLIVARSEALHLLLIANPTVRARVALRRAICVGSFEEALLRTTDPNFESDAHAIVECGGTSHAATDGAEKTLGTVQVVSYEPDRVELDAAATASAVLVLADAHYSGWRATVNGNPAPILPTNVAGRGLLLEPGNHHVVFSYRTPGLFPALVVSMATLVLGASCAFLGAWRRVRARRRVPG